MSPRAESVPVTGRGQRTRANLLRTARGLFESKGFLEARITDITAAANVSTGTFYTYFRCKEEIFAGVAGEAIDELFAASSAREDREHMTDPLRGIELANRRFLKAFAERKEMMRVIAQMATVSETGARIRRQLRSRFVRRAERGLRRLQQQGLADPTLDAYYAASALGSMVDDFAYVWHVLGEPFDEERAVATLTRLWAQAIGLKVTGMVPLPQGWPVGDHDIDQG